MALGKKWRNLGNKHEYTTLVEHVVEKKCCGVETARMQEELKD
jgi:hypothetical protein